MAKKVVNNVVNENIVSWWVRVISNWVVVWFRCYAYIICYSEHWKSRTTSGPSTWWPINNTAEPHCIMLHNTTTCHLVTRSCSQCFIFMWHSNSYPGASELLGMRMKLPILLLIQLDRLVTLIIVKTEQFHFFKIALNWLKIIQTLQVASRVIHKKMECYS